ncbi:MAG: translation initiation factor IF-2 N-terminal domain-containing protein [Deltaproteobacteria bacterium]
MEDEGTVEVVEKRVKPTVIRRRKRVTEVEPAPEEQTQEAADSSEVAPEAAEAAPEGPPPAEASKKKAPAEAGKKEARKKEPRVAKIPKEKTKPARVVGKVDLKAKPEPTSPEKVERLREEKPLEVVEEVVPAVPAGEEVREEKKGKKPGRREQEEPEGRPARRHRRRREVITIEEDELAEVQVPAARRGERFFPGRPAKKKVATRPHLKTQITTPKAIKKVIKISEVISVGELAQRMGAKVGQVIKKLMDLGVMTTVTQTIDVDTASLVATEFGIVSGKSPV